VSAAPSAPATPEPSASARVKRPPPATGPRGPAKAKSPDDLFGTQK
jgi:hypothetical protein